MLALMMQHVFKKSKELELVGAVSRDAKNPHNNNDYLDNALSFSETANKYAKYGSKGKNSRAMNVSSVLEKIKLPSFAQDRHSMSNEVRRVKGENQDINEASNNSPGSIQNFTTSKGKTTKLTKKQNQIRKRSSVILGNDATDKLSMTHKEILEENLKNQLFNVKYDLMEFNDLLGDERFIESYNSTSRVKGRQMQPKVRNGGCFFELKELDEDDDEEN